MSTTPNEFWLSLHTLTEAYQNEGITEDERTGNIIDQFHRMPPVVRQHVKAELDQMAVELSDLAIAVAAAQQKLKSSLHAEFSKVG